MIVLDAVTHFYGGTAGDNAEPALHNLNLRVAPGEAVCIMGHNGSGKSTLIKIIAGLLTPSRGRVTVNGEALGQERPSVGILFQNTDNQMVASLVEKELAFGLENMAMPQEQMEAEITAICERFRLTKLRYRLTGALSGGEKQRVALASIMIQNPPVLLLDEPDTFLDADGQRIVREELKRLHRELPGLAELRITQNPAIAREYPRMVIIDNGELVADGPPQKLLADQELMKRTGLSSEDRIVDSGNGVLSARRGAGNDIARVEVKSVAFGYPGGEPVFEGINFEINRGETVALVGSTGAGKSSLGLLLCGILSPNEGEVVYRSAAAGVIATSGIRGRVVAVLQQAERQFFLDTCAKEIAFGPANFGRDLTEREVTAYFDLVGLPAIRFRGRDPFTLSEGEKRRLAFAVALALHPSVLIFDEPTAGLDPAGVGRFLALSRHLKAAGVGQMVISHDRYLVRNIADRVLHLKGRSELRALDIGDLDSLSDVLAASF